MNTGQTWFTIIEKTLMIIPVIIVIVLGFSNNDSSQVMLTEICDNAIDDDNDGLIDLNDPDCACDFIEPVSLIPNPSFEELDCCPPRRSQLRCATGWVQASEPTTDFLHTCGWMGWDSFPPPQPFPDGEGIMGFRDGRVRPVIDPERDWKEYAGACLLGPMKAFVTYRFEFYVGFVDEVKSPPIDITFFGAADCAELPFGVGNQEFGCPTNGPGWVELGSTIVAGNLINAWVPAFIEVTPDRDINAIVIGAPCAPTESPEDTYYFFDNLLLSDLSFFNFRISPVGQACSDDYYLEVPEIAGSTCQWFKDGIALPGETNFEINKLYGDGLYQVRVDDANTCQVSLGYVHRTPVSQTSTNVSICDEETYAFGNQLLTFSGTYVDTFTTTEGCDSIVNLNLEVLGQSIDTVSALIIGGESYTIGPFKFEEAGEHLITLTSSQGCDSLVLLQLERFEVYIPNVFSPNGDGINDKFQVFSRNGLLDKVELQIYDRWGALVFEGPAWDGRYSDGVIQTGVYVYIARLGLSDGTRREFWGDVTVVK